MKQFENRVAMITGAGKNMGKEIALGFARNGASVIVCDYNEENTLQTVQEIEEMGGSAMAAVCDVRDREKISEYAHKAIQRFGKIDILVNNAGGSAALLKKLSHFVDAEPETLDFVVDTNLKGSMHCIQAVLPSMIENRCGKIINVSSIGAVCGLPGRADYCAAKAGLIGLSKALALELGEYNICVNCISPGAIQRDGKTRDHMTFMGANGREGTPREIAEAVMYLAYQEYITGENLVIDGGRTLGPNHR